MVSYHLGLFCSHNAGVALATNDSILEVVEIERLLSYKNAAVYDWVNLTKLSRKDLYTFIYSYFKEKYGVEKYDTVSYNTVFDDSSIEHCAVMHEEMCCFPAKKYIRVNHHDAHATGAFYQSPFNKALIITCDGGSDQGTVGAYIGEKQKDLVPLPLKREKLTNICTTYGIVGHFLKDIKKESLGVGNLVYPGKLMGLASYGVVRDDLHRSFNEFYDFCEWKALTECVTKFGEIFSYVNASTENRLTGKISHDLAATNQFVFENRFMKIFGEVLEQYSDLPLVIGGGSALNIILNTKLATNRKVYVPPNASDCGQAVNVCLHTLKPKKIVDCTYIGSEVWDKNDLPRIIFERTAKIPSIQEICNIIKQGKILGIVKGKSEHGPRALGNRSIICDPTIDNMKDILNLKVKGREYYRPFAPVVRLEDVSKYFEWDRESRCMSFCPKVTENYRNILKAITHVDGTARVQTVTMEQNPFLYELLTMLDEMSGIGVLLNTSFNIAGKPILNSYREALHVLDTTELDGIILEDYLIL